MQRRGGNKTTSIAITMLVAHFSLSELPSLMSESGRKSRSDNVRKMHSPPKRTFLACRTSFPAVSPSLAILLDMPTNSREKQNFI